MRLQGVSTAGFARMDTVKLCHPLDYFLPTAGVESRAVSGVQSRRKSFSPNSFFFRECQQCQIFVQGRFLSGVQPVRKCLRSDFQSLSEFHLASMVTFAIGEDIPH